MAADPKVGAVFLGDGTTHICTGSVLHSAHGDLVLTAAHCLGDGLGALFVPGFDGAASPPEVWTIDNVYLDPRWLSAQDPVADYAIARVSRAAGDAIEAAVGSALSLGAAPQAGTPVDVTGYALGVGGTPIECQADTTTVAGGFPSVQCGGLVDGTSGAPWITGSTVTGLIGGLDGGGCDENVSYSPVFDEHVVQLLARAEVGGPGDAPPSVLDNC